jgi:mannose-1-phosphate guanylyltransferase
MKTASRLVDGSQQLPAQQRSERLTQVASRAAQPSHVHGIVLAGVHTWGETLLERICPRPLLPVAGRPLIKHVIDWLSAASIRTAAVCANSDTAILRRNLESAADPNRTLDYYEDYMPRGPAGCLRDAALRTNHPVFLVADSSVVTRTDISRMLEAHQESGASVTVAVARLSSADNDEMGPAEPLGIYVISRDALEQIPAEGYQDIKERFIPQLRKCGKAVVPHFVEDDSTLRVTGAASYAAACSFVLRHMSCAGCIGNMYMRVGQGWAHRSAVVSSTARLTGPVFIGPGCVIEDGAVLVGPMSLEEDCVIGRDAIVSQSFLWTQCIVGRNAILDQCVVTNESQIEPDLVMRNTIWSRGHTAAID